MFRTMKLGLFVLTACLFITHMAIAKVVGREIKYKVDGQEFTGYLAYDDGTEAARPGVLVVH